MVLHNFQFMLLPFFAGIDGCHCYQSWQAPGRLHNQSNLPEPFIIPKRQVLMISLFHRHCSLLVCIWQGCPARWLLGCPDKMAPLKLKEQSSHTCPKWLAAPVLPAHSRSEAALSAGISSWVIAQHVGPFCSALVFQQCLPDMQISSKSKSKSKVWGAFVFTKIKRTGFLLSCFFPLKSLSVYLSWKNLKGCWNIPKITKLAIRLWNRTSGKRVTSSPGAWKSWMEDKAPSSQELFPCMSTIQASLKGDIPPPLHIF